MTTTTSFYIVIKGLLIKGRGGDNFTLIPLSTVALTKNGGIGHTMDLLNLSF